MDRWISFLFCISVSRFIFVPYYLCDSVTIPLRLLFLKKNAAAHTNCIVVAHFLWNVCQMFLLVHSFAHNQPDLFALELEIVHRNTHARQLQCRQSTVCKHNHFRILGEWSNNQRSFVYRCCYFSGALGCCCKCFCHAYISQAMVQCAWIVRPYMNNNNAK